MQLLSYSAFQKKRKIFVEQCLQDIITTLNNNITHGAGLPVTNFDELCKLSPSEFQTKVVALQTAMITLVNTSEVLSIEAKNLFLAKLIYNPQKPELIVLGVFSTLIFCVWAIAVLTFFANLPQPPTSEYNLAERVLAELLAIMGVAAILIKINKYCASNKNIWQDADKLEYWLVSNSKELTKQGMNAVPDERHSPRIAEV